MAQVRFKLDENLPAEMADLFNRAGHDAVTVLDEQLGGVSDPDLATVCLQERRAIVTLDSDFSDIRTYRPSAYSGIVVFRLDNQTRDHLLQVGARFLDRLSTNSLDGQLWIVEESRIRVRD